MLWSAERTSQAHTAHTRTRHGHTTPTPPGLSLVPTPFTAPPLFIEGNQAGDRSHSQPTLLVRALLLCLVRQDEEDSSSSPWLCSPISSTSTSRTAPRRSSPSTSGANRSRLCFPLAPSDPFFFHQGVSLAPWDAAVFHLVVVASLFSVLCSFHSPGKQVKRECSIHAGRNFCENLSDVCSIKHFRKTRGHIIHCQVPCLI